MQMVAGFLICFFSSLAFSKVDQTVTCGHVSSYNRNSGIAKINDNNVYLDQDYYKNKELSTKTECLVIKGFVASRINKTIELTADEVKVSRSRHFQIKIRKHANLIKKSFLDAKATKL